MHLTLLALASLTTGAVCPSRIQTKQEATTTNVGWEAVQSMHEHRLYGLIFFFDHPRTLRELPPDSVKKSEAGDRFFYVLPKGARQLWVECDYWGTSVVLLKQLPIGVTRCAVQREPHREDIKVIACS